jgi:hypothetical protein
LRIDASQVARLPIFFKQREDQFYPGWAFNLPSIITRLPYTVVEVLIWTVLTYYIVGLAPDPGRCVHNAVHLFFFPGQICRSHAKVLLVNIVLERA